MDSTKPQIITMLAPLLREAYALDEDTAAVLISSAVSALMGSRLQLVHPAHGKYPAAFNVFGLEPAAVARYLPIVKHLHFHLFEAQKDKFHLRQTMKPETLETIYQVQRHHMAKIEQKLDEVKFADLERTPRPRGFEPEESLESVEAIDTQRTVGHQAEKVAASFWTNWPLVLSREVPPEALEVWDKVSLDRCVHVYGNADRVFRRLAGSPPKTQHRLVEFLTAREEDELMDYEPEQARITLPMSVSFFLSISPPGANGQYLKALGPELAGILNCGWALPPLEPATTCPNKFSAEKSGYERYVFDNLARRLLKKMLWVGVSDATWKAYEEKQGLIAERSMAVQHPLLRSSLERAPMNALKIAALWASGNRQQHVPVNTYEEVWAMVDRLLARLEVHLRNQPLAPVEPELSTGARNMLDKLGSKGGKQTFRELSRSYSRMKRADLDALVEEARDAGLVAVTDQTVSLIRQQVEPASDVGAVGAVRGENTESQHDGRAQTLIEDRQNEAG